MRNQEERLELQREEQRIVASVTKVQRQLSGLTKKSPERKHLPHQLAALNDSLGEVKAKLLLVRASDMSPPAVPLLNDG